MGEAQKIDNGWEWDCLVAERDALQARVAELEALLVSAMEQRQWVQTDAERFWKERDRYREALEKIRDEDILREDMIDIAIQALNP